MTMKQILAFALLLIAAFSAQAAKTPEERANSIANNLEYHLKISADQKKAVYNLTLNRIADIEKAMAKKDAQSAKVIKRTYVSEVKKIIGQDKAGQYEALRMKFVENKKAGIVSEFPVIDENLEFLMDKSE